MTQKLDLYSLLFSYANKRNSPFVEISAFLDYLKSFVKKQSSESPALSKWAQEDGAVQFWSELNPLLDEGKCELDAGSDNKRIYLSNFYPSILGTAYQNIDEKVGLPFPSEPSLGFVLPEGSFLQLDYNYGLMGYLSEHGNAKAKILKQNFPDIVESALFLTDMIPRQLAEAAVLKLRNYLQNSGNKEYALSRLSLQMQGKEAFLQDQLKLIILRPSDVYRTIEEAGDLSHLFWSHFSTLIMNDVKKKRERISADIAVFQSVFILEAVSEYFKSETIKKRERDATLKNIESCLSKAPFFFSLGDILKFPGPKGGNLLNNIEPSELEEWLTVKTTESENNLLPDILIVNTNAGGEQFFLLKEKMLAMFNRLLVEGYPKLQQMIIRQWSKMLLECKREPAMDNDAAFERMLAKMAKKTCPMLISVVTDPKFFAVYKEMEPIPNGIPQSARVFDGGSLKPYSGIFQLRRRELLFDTKLTLPFWYSLPIIPVIIVFFKNLFGKNEKAPRTNETSDELDSSETKASSEEVRTMARTLESSFVPPGETAERYMERLEDRWSQILDQQHREDLISDVKHLAKERLRQNMRIQKNFRLDKEVLNQIAYDLVIHNPALSSISSREALITYIELYMVMLLIGQPISKLG